jgi:hypothetical protein
VLPVGLDSFLIVAWRIELKNVMTKYAFEGLKKWKHQVSKDENWLEYVNAEAKLIPRIHPSDCRILILHLSNHTM